jgi:hypothetical protein
MKLEEGFNWNGPVVTSTKMATSWLEVFLTGFCKETKGRKLQLQQIAAYNFHTILSKKNKFLCNYSAESGA